MSKWREPSDEEKLAMFKAKLNQVDVQPQYYRTADGSQPARMESGSEYKAPNGNVSSPRNEGGGGGNFCPSCGTKKASTAKFCPECGAKC